MGVGTVLILLALLQVKHMFADYYLQTPRMLSAGPVYVHMGRAMHCAEHVIGSAICLVLVGVPVGLMVPVLVAEFVAHYHIDWGKGVWTQRKGHGPDSGAYWRAFGMDQFLHQLTYVLMIWAVV